MEENTKHFQDTMLYYFKKDKNTTEMQKRFVQCVEKALWLIDHVKSSLQCFLVLLTFGQIILAVGLSYTLEDV